MKQQQKGSAEPIVLVTSADLSDGGVFYVVVDFGGWMQYEHAISYAWYNKEERKRARRNAMRLANRVRAAGLTVDECTRDVCWRHAVYYRYAGDALVEYGLTWEHEVERARADRAACSC